MKLALDCNDKYSKISVVYVKTIWWYERFWSVWTKRSKANDVMILNTSKQYTYVDLSIIQW